MKCTETCDWHKDDEPINETEHCQYCSRMLDSKTCEGCGQEFLDWSSTAFDDIIAGPCATNSGDLACIACVGRLNRDEEDDEDMLLLDDIDDDGL